MTLTTRQAADLLNVSHEYLLQLIEQKKIPYGYVGMYRRLKIKDVLDYKAKKDHDSKEALDELVRLTEEYGGYDKSR
jgi:excisionase family DNA binding protein